MAGERTFMDQALNVINSTPNHPLAGLVNPETGNWWGRSPYAAEAEHHPTVQAGHRLSSFAGGDRLALQDGHSNQLEGRFVERPGNPMQREAIEIGGIPVDPEDAKFWEQEGVIRPGTVANSPTSPGWQPGDTLVAPPPGAFSGTHEESLPGGAGTTIITGDGASAVLIAGMSDLAYLLGGGVSITGTLALLKGLSDLAEEAQDEPAHQTDDDKPIKQPPAKEPQVKDPPPKEPPPKEPPKEPPKDPPPKEPPKEPPKDPPPPTDPPPAEPPAKEPPPTGGSGDSSGGIPGASGGGSIAPEESSPGPSGGTSSLSSDHTSLLAFSYSPSDGVATADVPSLARLGDGFDIPGIGDGFDTPAPGGAFDVPGPEAGFDIPGPDDPFDAPGPERGFDVPGPEAGFNIPGIGDGFDIPGPDDPFDAPGPEAGFDIPGPDHGFDVPVTTAVDGLDDDFAVPPNFNDGPR